MNYQIAKLLSCSVVKLLSCELAIMERSPSVLVFVSGNPIKSVYGENVNQTENKSLIYDVGHLKVA